MKSSGGVAQPVTTSGAGCTTALALTAGYRQAARTTSESGPKRQPSWQRHSTLRLVSLAVVPQAPPSQTEWPDLGTRFY